MGEHSSKAFTTDKLKKFAVSGAGIGSRDRDKAAMTDDYGRTAAKTSDSSAYAAGGAAKAPSLGRAGRAGGGRVARAEGGKVRDITKVTDGGPWRYGDEPELRAKGGRAKRASGGSTRDDPPVMSSRPSTPEMDKENTWLGDTSDTYFGPKDRDNRARGGRTKGKGKTVVNVIVGGDKGQQTPPAPPPMAATGPVPP